MIGQREIRHDEADAGEQLAGEARLYTDCRRRSAKRNWVFSPWRESVVGRDDGLQSEAFIQLAASEVTRDP